MTDGVERAEREPVVLSKEQACEALVDGDYVHTFANPRGMLIGADWSRDAALKEIDEASRLEIGGEACKAMDHALVVWTGNRLRFLASKPEVIERLERAALSKASPAPTEGGAS